MNCNCNLTVQPYHQSTCALGLVVAGLTFVTDGSNLIPYINGIPQSPIDLTDVVQESESNTRLQLDISQRALVYTNERATSGTGSVDNIPLDNISKQIPLSGLKDVEYSAVSPNDLLVFNGDLQRWEPRTVAEDDAVSILGYNDAGQLIRTDPSDIGGGGGGGSAATLTIASAPSVTPDPTTYKQYSFTAQAETLVIGSPGVSSDGKPLIFRFRDNGVARTLSWNSIYRGVAVTIPTATIVGKVIYVGCIYNAQDNKWDVVSVNRQA